MQAKASRIFWPTAALVAGAVVFIWTGVAPSSSTVEQAAEPPTPTNLRVRPRGEPAAAPAPAARRSAAPPTRFAQVDALTKSGKPADAWAGYQRLALCLTDPSTCGDISPGQVAGRQDLLDAAAAAGVHGALYAMQTEATRATDDAQISQEALDEWHRRVDVARQAGAAHGDPFALWETALERAMARDWANFVAYATAHQLAAQADGVPTHSGFQALLDKSETQLSTDRFVAAVSVGNSLYQGAQK
jgi:hypothetical protein